MRRGEANTRSLTKLLSLEVQTSSQQIAQLIQKSSKIISFTGAGISTESGISDYRSKGGLWDRFVPVTIQEFLVSEEKRKEYWQTKMDLYESFHFAQPNFGHQAIVKLEAMGKLKGIITQNIDGLHQMAGNKSEKILELHGTNRETICLSCQDITSWEEAYQRLKRGETAPLCLKCGGLLKPNTISFGQTLNAKVLNKAFDWAQSADLVLALGSTLVVEPAASIPRIAKQNGAKLVIVTLSDTPLDGLADIKVKASIGETFSQVLDDLGK